MNNNANSEKDSIAAAKKKEQAAIAAAKKEEQRAQEERIRKERVEAEEKARQEKLLAEEQAREQKRLAEEKAAIEYANRSKFFITKIDGKNYECLGNRMDRKAYEKFLQENCFVAYNQYKKGKTCIGAGWGLFGSGLGIVAGGALYFCLCPGYSYEYAIAGSMMILGATATITSVPLLSVGYYKRDNAYKKYNNNCVSSISSLTLNVTAGQNGLGLALQF